MKKFEQVNAVSPELLKATKLEEGKNAVYRVASIQRNPANPSETIVPSAVSVPPIDQIWDEKKGEFVEIAAIKKVNKNGEHAYHDIWFWGSQGGHMILKAGSAQDQEIHSYLSLCNYNGSNPNRDTTKEVIFELVDEEKKSIEETKLRNIKRDALNAAADLSADDLKVYTAALGKDDTRPTATLRNELERMADLDPKGFMELIGNKQAVRKAIINRAITKGVLILNVEQSRFEWPNKEVILTVARTTGGDAVEELVAFCESSAKGEKVFQTIESKSKKP